MIIFQRTIEARIRDSLFKGRMLSVLGPRQSGKTTTGKEIGRGIWQARHVLRLSAKRMNVNGAMQMFLSNNS
jgi:predicted AAA+ superfamily ATPase